jgi:TPR repeat protein
MTQRRLHRGSPDRQLCALPRYRKAVRTLGYGQARHRSIGPLSPKPTVRALDADAITLLMKRGEQLVEAGDFAAARTLFQRAAEADEAAAAIALGATYDPAVLAGMRVVGIDADVGKARFWYQKAVSLGSSDAKRRLELLANR